MLLTTDFKFQALFVVVAVAVKCVGLGSSRDLYIFFYVAVHFHIILVLAGVSIAVRKHVTKGNLGRRGFLQFTFPHHSPPLREKQEHKQGRDLEAGINVESMEGAAYCLARLSFLSLFSYTSQTTFPEETHPIVGRALPHQSSVKKMSYRLAYNPILGRNFLKDSFFP